jgi:hypothetical protein
LNEHKWAVVWTGEAFAAVPLREAKRMATPLRKQHAIDLAEKLNLDVVTVDVAERFGPGEVTA